MKKKWMKGFTLRKQKTHVPWGSQIRASSAERALTSKRENRKRVR